MQTDQPDPYHFITNGQKQAKKPLFPLPNGKNGRIMVVAGGVLILIIIAVIVMSLISSAGKTGQAELLKAAQQQAELVRVSKIGLDRAKGSSARNLARTTNLSLQTAQATLTASLKSSGVKVSAKELALGKNAKTDTVLNAAEQANRFDEIFTETIQKELVIYQTTLKSAHAKTENKKLKATLATQFEDAGLLATAKQ